jgi:hypothetical protein
VKQTIDEGFIVTGRGSDWSNPNLILIKTNSMGDTIWTKSFNNLDDWNSWDYGWDVLQTDDMGFIVCGIGEGNLGQFAWLLKTDSLGNEIWSKEIEYNQVGLGATSIEQTIDGGFIIAIPGAGLYKTDDEGNQEWSNEVSVFDVKQTTDGGYIATTEVELCGFGGKIYLVKMDSSGLIEWEQTFGEEGVNYSRSVQETTDGGYIVAGEESFFNNTDGPDAFLLKTDSDGNEEWFKEFGENIDSGWEVQLTNDGGYVLCVSAWIDGWTAGLIKTDSEGNITNTSTIEMPILTSKIDLLKTIDILGRETSNKGLQLHIYDDGSVEKKYKF